MDGIRDSRVFGSGLVGATALVAALASASCGGDTTGGSAAPACAEAAGCGGDISGLWHVSSMCATYTQAFYESVNGGTALPSECTASLGRTTTSIFTPVDATIDFQPTQYTEAGSVHEALDFAFDAACMSTVQPSDVATFCPRLETEYKKLFDTATCTNVSGECECSVTKTSPFSASGGYTVQGTNLVFANGSTPNPFCVNGNTATLSISSSGLTATLHLSR